MKSKKPEKEHNRMIVHRFRLYPTDEQKGVLAQMFGNNRFLYNKLLALCQETYSLNQSYPGNFTLKSLIPSYKDLYPFLAANSVTELRHVVDHLDRAFQNFFNKSTGFPKFKKRSNRQSLACSQNTKLIGSLLSVEGIRNIPINLDKRADSKSFPKGNPKLATITREPSGKYYVSLTWDSGVPTPKPYTPAGVVAFDEGIYTQLATSYGRCYKASKPLKANAARLRRAQRSLARKKMRKANTLCQGRNREKARIKVARIHDKVANIREFEINSLIFHEVKKAKGNNQAIAIQASNKNNQLKNHKLAKALSDVATGSIISKLKSKCYHEGVPIIEINQWEPTSSVCHRCLTKNTALTLSHRKWRCDKCGTLHDRDVNAAKVMKIIALKELNIPAQGSCVNAWINGAIDRLTSDPKMGSHGSNSLAARKRKKGVIRDSVRREGIFTLPQEPKTQESNKCHVNSH